MYFIYFLKKIFFSPVTPSSKVVGDLAQFMVTNNITSAKVFFLKEKKKSCKKTNKTGACWQVRNFGYSQKRRRVFARFVNYLLYSVHLCFKWCVLFVYFSLLFSFHFVLTVMLCLFVSVFIVHFIYGLNVAFFFFFCFPVIVHFKL